MISVILPTYERGDAVLCALAGLEHQTLNDFEIIVVDDSDGDAVLEAISVLPHYRIKYIRSSPPRTGSFTAGRARNIGAANAKHPLLVFVDQDVILAPDALAYYADIYARHGDNTVILGLYHWLVRMDFGPKDVVARFNDICLEGFPKLPMDEPGLLGPDKREKHFTDNVDGVIDDAALGAWSGNIGYPRKLFIELGGFDENIDRHGGEDADLGLTAKGHGVKFLCYRKIWGVHRWHSRNQAQNAKDVQVNIEYIDRKHGVGKYAGAKRFGEVDAQDWSNDRYYQKEFGAVLMRIDGDPTVWAIREGHRLALPAPDWVTKLGFVPGEVLMLLPGGLSNYKAEGVAGAN